MSMIDTLKRNLQVYRNQVANEKANVDKYQLKIDEIDKIYKQMKQKKSEMKSHKKDVSSFSKKQYTNWKGNLFSKEYQTKVQDNLIGQSYEQVLKDIDTNLDALIDKKTMYQNKIAMSNGIIGAAQVGINSLLASIAKLVN